MRQEPVPCAPCIETGTRPYVSMKEGKVILFNFIVIRFLVWVHLSQAADSRWLYPL